MNEISNYFRPIAWILVGQLVVDVLRLRSGKRPMGAFILCALALVLMDMFATLFLLTTSLSDFPDVNTHNGVLLGLVGAMACVGFLPAYFRLIVMMWTGFRAERTWALLPQTLPTLGLALVFLAHSIKVFETAWVLCRVG